MIQKQIFIFISFFLVFNTSLLAQEATKSDSIKWVDGQKYYIHTVTSGQGLFSIQKLYGVKEKDILENNPEAFDGLKPGQYLKIPFIKQETKKLDYRIHVIKAGESIYSISKIYNITPEEIFKLNKEAKNGYKINQELKIPLAKEKAENQQQEKEKKGNGKTYKVKKKDTVYSLSKKFDVSQSELIELNPIIKKDGLKKGQKIIIPKKEIIIPEALYVPLDSIPLKTIEKDNTPCDSVIIDRTKPMNIGLLLPFEMDKTILEKELSSNSNQKPKISNKPFLEYYQGLLLALKELKAEGLNINLHVYNTKRDSNEIKRIIQKGEFKTLDLIFGPVYKDNFKIIQKATDSLSIPLVNPILKGTNLVENSNYTIDLFANETVIQNKTIDLISKNDSSKIFFVHSGFVDDLVLTQPFFKKYKKYLTENNKDSLYKELIFSDSKKINFKPFLDKKQNNLIIVLSDNQAFVSNVFTKLNICTEDFDIQLIARPKWNKFSNIDLKYFHNLNTIQINDEYIDYNKNKELIIFLKSYRKFYNIEATKYALYGYDQVLYFTSFFYSNNQIRCLTKHNSKGLIFNFDIKKYNRGWLNEGLFIIHYNKDFTQEIYEENVEPKSLLE